MSECEFCGMLIPIAGKLEDVFQFQTEDLHYNDAPISGWVRCRKCNSRYAFNCTEIVSGMLWHWAFIGSGASDKVEAEAFFLDVQKKNNFKWLSIVEDRRIFTVSIYTSAWIESVVAQPSLH